MNYYIVTEEVFNTLTKENVSFMRKSIDKSKRCIATTDTVSNNMLSFENINTCSSYTFTNHSEWVGDKTGVEVWEIEELIYVPETDG
jgi:hypothetical protein|tara:strand:- start:192 stop:452 length:261 start_codon:yes stop_codon:yes gene_type:complete